MRVSEYFKLGRKQAELDFVDVDIRGDTPVFLSPRALTLLPTKWGDECVHLIQDFFQKILQLIRDGKNAEAENLLRALRDPNETHLGLSKGRSRGHALGTDSAHDVWRALSRSEAAKSGLLRDLEDTILMIEGISVDIVSDIATNIIRGPLIQYTQEMAELYGIPLSEGVATGPIWDPKASSWKTGFNRLPVARGGRLLLVPKAIVRRHLEYDADEYYRHFLLEHLREIELNANSALVELLKNGKRRVTKQALKQKYGFGKKAIVRATLKYPEALARYRKAKEGEPHPPLTHEQIAEAEADVTPEWDKLLSAVISLPTGRDVASDYERAIEGLLTALFYPIFAHPRVQHEIHDGRKRIDITYANMSGAGFFKWLAAHYPAAHVFVECKNYGREIGNPELDQLAGRFSPSRGQFGLLVCRSFEDKQLFFTRCRDTARDQRGFIIPLDDEDLKLLVASRKTDPLFFDLPLLRGRFTNLIT
ncbi:MAG TPA: hypothetical protein VK653_06020 [Xanthobacteraceae bacterium]|nr:hypothetical protein [Xanthobacteraceae bacterium]